jgi:hypothetical protein
MSGARQTNLEAGLGCTLELTINWCALSARRPAPSARNSARFSSDAARETAEGIILDANGTLLPRGPSTCLAFAL